MKKILIISLAIFTLGVQSANSTCPECYEINKQIKKEIKIDKTQKKEIKKIKKEMRTQIKKYQKEIKKNQKSISKILNADCPDIVTMVKIKTDIAKIKTKINDEKKEAIDQIFNIYNEDQQYIIKRILSENTYLESKKTCDFCNNRGKMKLKCKKFKK